MCVYEKTCAPILGDITSYIVCTLNENNQQQEGDVTDDVIGMKLREREREREREGDGERERERARERIEIR